MFQQLVAGQPVLAAATVAAAGGGEFDLSLMQIDPGTLPAIAGLASDAYEAYAQGMADNAADATATAAAAGAALAGVVGAEAGAALQQQQQQEEAVPGALGLEHPYLAYPFSLVPLAPGEVMKHVQQAEEGVVDPQSGLGEACGSQAGAAPEQQVLPAVAATGS